MDTWIEQVPVKDYTKPTRVLVCKIFLNVPAHDNLSYSSHNVSYKKDPIKKTSLYKKWGFPLKISSVNVTKSAVWADLLTFAEKILNGKLNFYAVPAACKTLFYDFYAVSAALQTCNKVNTTIKQKDFYETLNNVSTISLTGLKAVTTSKTCSHSNITLAIWKLCFVFQILTDLYFI